MARYSWVYMTIYRRISVLYDTVLNKRGDTYLIFLQSITVIIYGTYNNLGTAVITNVALV